MTISVKRDVRKLPSPSGLDITHTLHTLFFQRARPVCVRLDTRCEESERLGLSVYPRGRVENQHTSMREETSRNRVRAHQRSRQTPRPRPCMLLCPLVIYRAPTARCRHHGQLTGASRLLESADECLKHSRSPLHTWFNFISFSLSLSGRSCVAA